MDDWANKSGRRLVVALLLSLLFHVGIAVYLGTRETDKTQKIERARRHCARILDGLNALRASQSEEKPPPTPEAPVPLDDAPKA